MLFCPQSTRTATTQLSSRNYVVPVVQPASMVRSGHSLVKESLFEVSRRFVLYSTEPFTGRRLVIVAYTAGASSRLESSDVSYLSGLGFSLPSACARRSDCHREGEFEFMRGKSIAALSNTELGEAPLVQSQNQLDQPVDPIDHLHLQSCVPGSRSGFRADPVDNDLSWGQPVHAADFALILRTMSLSWGE